MTDEDDFAMVNNSWAFLAVVTIAALASRVALLAEPPIYDEYFHILAADSWLRHNQTSILDGEYSRAALFTKMMAASLYLFGDNSWTNARIFPSLICGVLLVPVVTYWVMANVGKIAATSCAIFLIFWPVGIETSQFARFYSLQGFLFVLGAIALYATFAASGRPDWQRAAFAVISAALFLVALPLQLITAIGLIGAAIWVGLFVGLPALLRKRSHLMTGCVIGAAAVAAFFALNLDESVIRLWRIYQTAPPDWQRDVFYYHRNLRDEYPTFWPLFPFACLVAFARAPRLTAYCALIFGVNVFVLSFGIRNDMKYLYQSFPFFFVVWAIFFQVCFDRLWAFLSGRAREASVQFARGRQFARGAALNASAIAMIVGVVGFAVAANAAFHRSTRLIAGVSDGMLFEEARRAWPEASELIEPWIERDALIVTSHPILAAAFIGDFDVSFNRTHFHDNEKELSEADRAAQPVYVTDMRDGRPVIAKDAALMRLIQCVPVGVAVFPSPVAGSKFERQFFVNARDLPIELTVSQGRNMALIGWRTRRLLDAAACADLPLPKEGGAAKRLEAGETKPVFGPSVAGSR